MIHETIAFIFMTIGTLFMLIAAWGLLRMPDLYMRMQTATKAASIGAGFVLFGSALYFANLDAFARAVATIIFIFLTTPLAAHLLARSAHRRETPKWVRTKRDDLEEEHREMRYGRRPGKGE